MRSRTLQIVATISTTLILVFAPGAAAIEVTFSFASDPAVAVFEIGQTTDSLKTVPSSITWYESGLSGGITITVQDIQDSIYIGPAGGYGTVWDIYYGTAGQPGWGYAGIEDFAGTAGIESNTTWDELISRSPISLVGVANGQESFYFSYRDDMNTFHFREINDVLYLSTASTAVIPEPNSVALGAMGAAVQALRRRVHRQLRV